MLEARVAGGQMTVRSGRTWAAGSALAAVTVSFVVLVAVRVLTGAVHGLFIGVASTVAVVALLVVWGWPVSAWSRPCSCG
jgi:hypothetical protein